MLECSTIQGLPQKVVEKIVPEKVVTLEIPEKMVKAIFSCGKVNYFWVSRH